MESQDGVWSITQEMIWVHLVTSSMLGILTVPTRWFWDGNLKDFHDMRFKKDPFVALDTRLRRTRLVIYSDGYVVIGTNDRRLGAEFLNAWFLALGLVTGRTTESVTEKSLEEVDLERGQRVRKRWSMIQLANFLETYPTCQIPGYKTVHIREEMEANLQATIFGTAELRLATILGNRIMESDRPAVVSQHLETIGHLVAGDWMAASLLGWITIEQAIDYELELHLAREGESLREARKSVRRMTEYEVVQQLMIRRPLQIGRHDPTVLTKTKLKTIHGLRELRNLIAHGDRRATERDASRMKKGSEMAMWRMFRHNQFNYGELFKSIRAANRAREERLWRLPTP